MSLTLVFPLPPNRGNARGHWRTRRAKDLAWEARALPVLVLRDNFGRTPPCRMDRFTVALHVVTKRPQDLDNAVARGKPVLDLLKKRGWIVDDGPQHMVSLTVTTAVDTKHPRLEVTLSVAAR